MLSQVFFYIKIIMLFFFTLKNNNKLFLYMYKKFDTRSNI